MGDAFSVSFILSWFDMIQAEPAFLLLNQEDKRRHCSQGRRHKASLRKCAFLLVVGIMSVPSEHEYITA